MNKNPDNPPDTLPLTAPESGGIDDDGEGLGYIPAHVLRAMPNQGCKGDISIKQRWNAVLAWSTTGNAASAARAAGLQEATVRAWTGQAWFEYVLAEVLRQRRRSIDAALSGVIERSLEETMDRLENGDCALSHGVMIRIPVRAKDAAFIAALAIDKQRLLRGESTSRVERVSLGDIRKQLGQIIEGESQSIGNNDDPKAQTLEESES